MRHHILLATCFVIGMANTGNADTATDEIIFQLQSQGYSQIEVKRTWLGRMRIFAVGDGVVREIVINPVTGEILRDARTKPNGSAASAPIQSLGMSSEKRQNAGNNGNANGGKGQGKSPTKNGNKKAGDDD